MKHEEISLNTKKALAEALKAAMKEKPFQKISVSELVRATNMNRKTFYYHFEDIYALLKWILEEETISVIKSFDMLVDYEEAITFVMDYVEENEYIINCAFDSIGRDELKRFFYTDFHDIVVSIIETEEQKMGRNLDVSYKEFLIQFYIEALAGMLIEWIREREKRDRRTVMEYMLKTIRGSLTGILTDE